jgi:hypothetical protein
MNLLISRPSAISGIKLNARIPSALIVSFSESGSSARSMSPTQIAAGSLSSAFHRE